MFANEETLSEEGNLEFYFLRLKCYTNTLPFKYLWSVRFLKFLKESSYCTVCSPWLHLLISNNVESMNCGFLYNVFQKNKIYLIQKTL